MKLGGGGDDELTAALQRANGKVLYEYLLTPNVAHALSGVQVAASLCELLPKLYRKLAESPQQAPYLASQSLSEAVMKADALLEEYFLAPAVKHADGLARAALSLNLGRLDPLFARIRGSEPPQEAVIGALDNVNLQ